MCGVCWSQSLGLGSLSLRKQVTDSLWGDGSSREYMWSFRSQTASSGFSAPRSHPICFPRSTSHKDPQGSVPGPKLSHWTHAADHPHYLHPMSHSHSNSDILFAQEYVTVWWRPTHFTICKLYLKKCFLKRCTFRMKFIFPHYQNSPF